MIAATTAMGQTSKHKSDTIGIPLIAMIAIVVRNNAFPVRA